MKLRSLLCTLLLPVSMSLAACADAGTGDDLSEETAEAEADLSASGIQVLGSIGVGETLTAQYKNAPRYRAYSFAAKKGDIAEFWVRSPSGGDGYAYILGANFATLKSNNNANSGTKDARVKMTIPADGTYYVAFRDSAYKPATLTVQFVDNRPPPPPPVIQTCTGTPRFPVTGPLHAQGTIQYNYERDCDAFGVCSAWTLKSQRPVSSSTSYGTTSVDQNRRAKLEFRLNSYMSQQGSSLYSCTTTDRDANWSTQLDANGQGQTSLRWEDRCNISGGSGGPYDIGDPRPVTVSFGATCLSVTEVDPPANRNFGRQTKQVYISQF